MRRFAFVGWFGTVATLTIIAQTPPGILPSSITGRPTPSTITPAAASLPKQPPIARFHNLQNFSPETAATVMALRGSAEWLSKRQLAHGRFLFGVNPALRTPLDGDSEFRQALATWSLCQSAQFTGDEKLLAAAGQAVLTLLTYTQDDPADAASKLPLSNAKNGGDIGFAAALALAIYSLPTLDAKLTGEAEKLCTFLRKQILANGSIPCGDAHDPDCANWYPGLVLQALTANRRVRSDAVIAKSLAYYRAQFKARPHAMLAGSILPAAVDFCLETKDANAAATVFEMADWLCSIQHGMAEVKQILWSGGFPTDGRGQPMEPSFESAIPARGLACACQLIRQGVPDLARYQKYRAATLEALAFLRGLQYTNENSSHFTADFRSQYLLGGVRAALTDGNVRIDSTALTALAFQKFLESGAEQQ